MVRCFEDDDVTHVEGRIDPVADAETVETELMLADLESLEKRRPALEKKAKGQDKDAKALLPVIDKALALLREGRPARLAEVSDEERPLFTGLQLLTAKPVLYVCNVSEDAAGAGNAHSDQVKARAEAESAGHVVISAKIEAEIAQLSDEEQAEYLETLGLEEPGLNRLIRAGYALLGLETYFTAGPQGSARVDDPPGHESAPGRRCHPHGFRKRVHPC